MASVGLVAGVLYSFGGAAIDLLVTIEWVTSATTPGLSWGTALAFLALIGMPVFFAVFGLASGVVAASLRKLVAAKVDGWDGRTQRSWVVSIGGSALACGLIGGIVGGLFGGGNSVVEETFGGGFYGALIGGCLVGNVLAIVRSLPR